MNFSRIRTMEELAICWSFVYCFIFLTHSIVNDITSAISILHVHHQIYPLLSYILSVSTSDMTCRYKGEVGTMKKSMRIELINRTKHI